MTQPREAARAGAGTGPQQQGTPSAAGRRGTPAATFVITGVALFMISLDTLVVTNALTRIRIDLRTGLQGLEWTINAYTLTFSVLLLLCSALGDRYGRRKTLLGGLTLFTAASAVAAIAPNISVLIAARAVQGIGGAAVVPLSLTVLAQAVPPQRREIALTGWSAMAGLAIALGPVIGGVIVQEASWQWIFWLNVPLGLVLVPLGRLRLAESHGPNDRLDLTGTVLVTLAFFGIVSGLVRANSSGWTSPLVLGGITGGAALLVAFAAWERRASQPMVPPRLIRIRGFTLVNAVALLVTTGMFGVVFLLAQFLQVVQGYNPLAAGLRTLPWTAAPMIVAPLSGILAPKLGIRRLVSFGLALQIASLIWLARGITVTVPYIDMVPALILAGTGMGVFFALLAPLALSYTSPDDEGTASGVNNAMRELGVVLGVAVLAAVFAANGSYATRHAFVAGLTPALWLGAAVVTGAFVISLFVPAPDRD
jgi:EmrB/QacA subfamily drug resistance transporter